MPPVVTRTAGMEPCCVEVVTAEGVADLVAKLTAGDLLEVATAVEHETLGVLDVTDEIDVIEGVDA